MSNKTIAKFYAFVISLAIHTIFFSACSNISSKESKREQGSRYEKPKIIGRIKSGDISEGSGIAASRCQNEVLWTHNDSDNGAYIFAFKPSGESLGTWRVHGAGSTDWEDIAAYKDNSGKCYLYIGDIGDNDLQFSERSIYRIAEPIVKDTDSRSDRNNPLTTETAEVIRFRYPDTRHNAETLMVQPTTGAVYILTKRMNGPSAVYRIEPDFSSTETQKGQKIGEVAVPAVPNGFLTGGDISPDGKRIIVCDYTQAYELVLPENASNFDLIWTQKPEVVDLGERKQGEAVCYSVDGQSIFAISEGKKSPVIDVKRR